MKDKQMRNKRYFLRTTYTIELYTHKTLNKIISRFSLPLAAFSPHSISIPLSRFYHLSMHHDVHYIAISNFIVHLKCSFISAGAFPYLIRHSFAMFNNRIALIYSVFLQQHIVEDIKQWCQIFVVCCVQMKIRSWKRVGHFSGVAEHSPDDISIIHATGGNIVK